MTDISRESVERWEVTHNAAGLGFSNGIRKSPHGNFVTLQDYEALRAEVDALEAKLAERVTVKPLEWEGDGFWSRGPNEGWMEEANTTFGWGYSIEIGSNGEFEANSTFDCSQGGFDTPDAAKAAAQADYERRILSALTTAPITPAEAAKVLLEALGDEYAPHNRLWITIINAALSAGDGSKKVRGSDAILAALRAIAQEGNQ